MTITEQQAMTVVVKALRAEFGGDQVKAAGIAVSALSDAGLLKDDEEVD